MADKPASFTRIFSFGDPNVIKVAHMDGQVTTFATGAAYGIFVAGLRHTNYTLYDEVQEQWVVGSIGQLDDTNRDANGNWIGNVPNENGWTP